MLMHGGLICIALCLSVYLTVCPSVCDWTEIYWTIIHIAKNIAPRATKFGQGVARDDPKVDLEGQGHSSKVKVTRSEIVILGLHVVLQVMRSRSRGSRSEVTWVKVKDHLG